MNIPFPPRYSCNLTILCIINNFAIRETCQQIDKQLTVKLRVFVPTPSQTPTVLFMHLIITAFMKEAKLFCQFILNQPDANICHKFLSYNYTTLTQTLKYLAETLWRLGRFA